MQARSEGAAFGGEKKKVRKKERQGKEKERGRVNKNKKEMRAGDN